MREEREKAGKRKRKVGGKSGKGNEQEDKRGESGIVTGSQGERMRKRGEGGRRAG